MAALVCHEDDTPLRAGVPGFLTGSIAAALKTLSVQHRFTELGLVAKSSTPVLFGDFMKSEMKKWAEVVQASK